MSLYEKKKDLDPEEEDGCKSDKEESDLDDDPDDNDTKMEDVISFIKSWTPRKYAVLPEWTVVSNSEYSMGFQNAVSELKSICERFNLPTELTILIIKRLAAMERDHQMWPTDPFVFEWE